MEDNTNLGSTTCFRLPFQLCPKYIVVYYMPTNIRHPYEFAGLTNKFLYVDLIL